MIARVGKIYPGIMEEEDMEPLLFMVETAIKSNRRTVFGKSKYTTRVQRFSHQTPEDWSYPKDWKKQKCRYFCPAQEDEQC